MFRDYSTFQVGCLREIGSNGEIGIRSIDAKLTHTTNPIVYNYYDQDNRIMVNVILKYLPIALFLSNNHPEIYYTVAGKAKSDCLAAML